MPNELISFKSSDVLTARIDEMARKGHGGNRSGAIKAAILKADARPDQDVVPDEAEVMALLGEAARAGNVTAMKELRVYHREQKSLEQSRDAVDDLDELAVRRSA